MNRRIGISVALLVLFPAGAALALPWDKDMQDQPSVKPQETRVDEPRHSVPADRAERYDRPADVAEVVQTRMRAARELDNPVRADAASIGRGREMYDVHCLPCHGAGGRGDGPVGKKFVPPPMDLTTDYVQNQADGQIYYTITHGGVAMPFYHDALTVEQRWDIVNFIKTGMAPVPTAAGQ